MKHSPTLPRYVCLMWSLVLIAHLQLSGTIWQGLRLRTDMHDLLSFDMQNMIALTLYRRWGWIEAILDQELHARLAISQGRPVKQTR